jgi:hypothetical protein
MSKCPFGFIAEKFNKDNPDLKTTKESYPKETFDESKLSIIAHDVGAHEWGIEIETAPSQREWMSDTNGHAYKCLPLTSANNLGWVVRCPSSFSAYWDGRNRKNAVRILPHTKEKIKFVQSHFGYGTLTFHPGYIFSTTKNHGLYVKGPTNLPNYKSKNGITPLDGLVETDWLQFSFTMNWKFTETRRLVTFYQDDIFCQFFPYPRSYISQFETHTRLIEESEGFNDSVDHYKEHRRLVNKAIDETGIPPPKDLQLHYLRGKNIDGTETSIEELGFVHEPKCGAKKFPVIPKEEIEIVTEEIQDLLDKGAEHEEIVEKTNEKNED